ncbi:MAG: hypothetical protein H6638_15440 [Ardenticatenales bacterium]|nr:hypothetical protein [Ardenticatenales bacterium]
MSSQPQVSFMGEIKMSAETIIKPSNWAYRKAAMRQMLVFSAMIGVVYTAICALAIFFGSTADMGDGLLVNIAMSLWMLPSFVGLVMAFGVMVGVFPFMVFATLGAAIIGPLIGRQDRVGRRTALVLSALLFITEAVLVDYFWLNRDGGFEFVPVFHPALFIFVLGGVWFAWRYTCGGRILLQDSLIGQLEPPAHSPPPPAAPRGDEPLP